MTEKPAHLQCENLSVAVANQPLVSNLTLDIQPGNFVCVLGTNGVGKTLTLHTLAGLRRPSAGQLHICGDELANLSRREIAKRLGLLLQIQIDTFPLTVMESVLHGRYPYLGLWKWAGDSDRKIARDALHAFDIADLENRQVSTLSGGERERMALATLQVQDPAIWLLDEPMNHLDPHHQLDVLNTLQQRANENRIVITTVHNPAMAMRFASQVLLLFGDGKWEYGPAGELLEPIRLERLYQTPFDYYQNENNERRVLLPS